MRKIAFRKQEGSTCKSNSMVIFSNIFDKSPFWSGASWHTHVQVYYSVLFQSFHDGNSSTAPLWLHTHLTFLLPPRTLYNKGYVASISCKKEAFSMRYSRKTNKLALFLVSIFWSCICSKGLKLSPCASYVVFYNIFASCLQLWLIWDKARQEAWILLCRVCICPFIFLSFEFR